MSKPASCAGQWLTGLVCTLVFSISATRSAADFIPRHTAAHLLSDGDLVVEVMDPNNPERYNRGARFSPVASVLRAVKNGKDFLFSPVKHNPEKDNAGLPMEFDLSRESPPPGFSEAKIGEGYLKIGVGIVRKITKTYNFFNPGELISPAPTTVTWGKNQADFEQIFPEFHGYAYTLSAGIRIQSPTIFIRCKLTNTGTKPIVTEQYTHNFFSFDNAPVGPDYEVRFPYDFDVSGLPPSQKKNGRSLFYLETLSTPLNTTVIPPANFAGPGTVLTRQTANGQQITATTSLPVTRTFVHANAAYLCPEQFVRISLRPGESLEWTRRYELEGSAP